MAIRLLIFSLLIVCNAFAAISIEESIVKTRSSRCTGGSALRGSGTLFWQNGKAYVLSSDHVILHGNKDFCHFVNIPKLKREFKAKFLASEWGLGLALLSVDELNQPLAGLQWADLKFNEELEPGRHVVSYGFPSTTEELSIDYDGSIASTQIEKPFYVLLRKMVHVTGANGEFGMSGGACFENTGAKPRFVGVLSHQKLDPSGTSNELFIIPAKVAVNWLERYFNSPENFKIYFFEHPEGQLVPEFTMILTKDFIFMPLEGEGTFAIGLRFIPQHSVPHEMLFEPGFNLELYQDPNYFLEKFTKYVFNISGSMSEESSASIRIYRSKNGALENIPMNYFSEFFLALNEPGIKSRTRVSLFHDERAEPLRNIAKEYDRRVSEVQLLLTNPNPLAEEFFKEVGKLGEALKTVPMFPIVPPGSMIAEEFFTYSWLWARKAEVGSILKNEKFQPLWKEIELKNFAKKKALHDLFLGVDKHLFVDEI